MGSIGASEVLDRGSVTGAARALGLTQPTVSHALARLRALLGDALLVRAGLGMRSTPRAEALAPAVPRVRVALVWHERMQSDPGHRFLRELFAEFGGRRARPPAICAAGSRLNMWSGLVW